MVRISSYLRAAASENERIRILDRYHRLGKTLVDRHKLLGPLAPAKKCVPTRKLLLDGDHRDGQLGRILRRDSPANRWIAVSEQREDVGVQNVQAHGALRSLSTFER
jgi:hypothetical protein